MTTMNPEQLMSPFFIGMILVIVGVINQVWLDKTHKDTRSSTIMMFIGILLMISSLALLIYQAIGVMKALQN